MWLMLYCNHVMPQPPENSNGSRITDVSMFSEGKTSISPKLGHIHNEQRTCAAAIILITSICKVASLLL